MSTGGLSRQQVEAYRTEGYLVVPAFFGAERLAEVDRTIREITCRAMEMHDFSKVLEIEPEPVDGRRVPRRIYNPFEQHETFRALATDPPLMDCLESLIGPNIDLQHSKLNMKLARVGSVVEWHQDLSYFPHTNSDLVTLLVYLDDASEENGCLQVLPRHHHHFFKHTTPDGRFAGMITEQLSDGQYGKPVPLEAPAGSLILMHCMTPHSSLPNRSTRPRRTLIFEYRASDSFPIYYGERTVDDESLTHHLRGEVCHFARMGTISPFVPVIPEEVTSLYSLQAMSKQAMVTG